MKNNPISKLSRLLMIIPVLLLLFSSCRQEEPYSAPSPGFTPVTFSVSVSNDAAPASGDAASVINDLCILQFYANKDGSFGTLRHAGMCDHPAAGTKYQTRLLQSNYGETYKFVVVANLPRHGFAYYQSLIGKNYRTVQKELLSESSEARLDFTAATPFPMFGIPGDGTPQTIGATLNLNTVSLIRAVARVDIGIGERTGDAEWDKKGVKFNMTEVQIWKAGKQYAYMPLANSFSASGGNVTGPSPVGDLSTKELTYKGTDITNGTYCADKIYLPEANLQWGKVYDDKHSQRTAIIVKGKYDTSNKETYYRVDFTEDANGVSTGTNILRNHRYQFTITAIADDGYGTAQEAYDAKPQGLSFTASIDKWQTGVVDGVPSLQEGFLMSYGSQNGAVTEGNGIKITEKSPGWTGENPNPLLTVDYNTFYGEVPGNLRRSPAFPNGDIYPDISAFISVEGVYPALMVSTDDVYDSDGSFEFHWKDGLVFTAFDICRSYTGLGRTDWRLPRASELALMCLNRASLEKQRGFTAFSGTYWSGSEQDADTETPVAANAWAVNFDSTSPPSCLGADKTTVKYKIRCVRQFEL